MNQRFNRPVALLFTGLLTFSSGCSFMHELSPNRLWRLNRTAAPRGSSPSEAYYSIPDPPVAVPDEVKVSAAE
jgi:hypothetical protein